MTRFYAANNWKTTIAEVGGIDNSVTSFDVASVAGAPDTPFKISVENEIMDVTDITGVTLTVDRGREGTNAASHANGTPVEHRFTAGTLNELWGDHETHKTTYLNHGNLKNKIINGNFSINQRGVSDTVTLSAGEYGHDRWKAGAGGCEYTFATVENVTTITIASGTLQQVIEGVNLFSGTHCLSWVGTAQGKIGAGSYGDSGITGSVTGGTNLTIEFGTGTLSKVQLEEGTYATPFEQRPADIELLLCGIVDDDNELTGADSIPQAVIDGGGGGDSGLQDHLDDPTPHEGYVVPRDMPITEQTGATYTLQVSDNLSMIKMNRGTAQTLIFPLDATANIPVGGRGIFVQAGAGKVTVQGEVNGEEEVTLLLLQDEDMNDEDTTTGQNAMAGWVKDAANTFRIRGDLEAGS